jgi:murein DD-endopeptidase MepM/ murein hydrolase activator NlpD
MSLRILALTTLLVAAPGVSSARTIQTDQRGEDSITPSQLIARFTSVLDFAVVPDTLELTDRWIRVRLGIRDLMHAATERLASFADASGFRIPDLTVLSAQPVAPSQSTWATSGFGWREDPIRKRAKFHRGDDIRAKSGTPVFAAGDGVVVFAGRQGGYGNVIYVDHGGGVVTRYGHLRRIEAKKDAAITAGQQIGQVGSTGRATGPHLHFEVRLDGRAVDPSTALTIAELERQAPGAGHLASFALAPEMQERAESDLDPPKDRKKSKGARPERPGRTKRVRPIS